MQQIYEAQSINKPKPNDGQQILQNSEQSSLFDLLQVITEENQVLLQLKKRYILLVIWIVNQLIFFQESSSTNKM